MPELAVSGPMLVASAQNRPSSGMCTGLHLRCTDCIECASRLHSPLHCAVCIVAVLDHELSGRDALDAPAAADAVGEQREQEDFCGLRVVILTMTKINNENNG